MMAIVDPGAGIYDYNNGFVTANVQVQMLKKGRGAAEANWGKMTSMMTLGSE